MIGQWKHKWRGAETTRLVKIHGDKLSEREHKKLLTGKHGIGHDVRRYRAKVLGGQLALARQTHLAVQMLNMSIESMDGFLH